MIWSFSDGTTVELGGKVDGPTLLAQRLRADLDDRPTVQVWPEPTARQPLDPNDPALLEAWLREHLDFFVRIRELTLRLISPPGIPALPAPPWGDAPSDPTVIY